MLGNTKKRKSLATWPVLPCAPLGLVSTSVPRLLLALTPLGRVLSRLPVDVGIGTGEEMIARMGIRGVSDLVLKGWIRSV